MAPSRKWWAARVTALTGLAIMWATTGAWDQEETIAAITFGSAAALSWLLPNEKDPAEERGLTLVEVLVVLLLILVVLIAFGYVR